MSYFACSPWQYGDFMYLNLSAALDRASLRKNNKWSLAAPPYFTGDLAFEPLTAIMVNTADMNKEEIHAGRQGNSIPIFH